MEPFVSQESFLFLFVYLLQTGIYIIYSNAPCLIYLYLIFCFMIKELILNYFFVNNLVSLRSMSSDNYFVYQHSLENDTEFLITESVNVSLYFSGFLQQ